MANTFPFGADEGGAEESGGSRKALFAVLGGVLVLALLGYFLVLPALSGGDSSPVAVSVVRKPAKKPAAKKPAAKKPAATTTKIYHEPIARDPFKHLWFKPQPVETANPGTVPVTTDGSTGSTGSTGGTTDGSTGTGSGTGGSDGTVSTLQHVALVKVFTRQGITYAQTRVNDAIYTPAVGQVFGGSYKLLAVGNGTATYLFGDERFVLREGQEVVK